MASILLLTTLDVRSGSSKDNNMKKTIILLAIATMAITGCNVGPKQFREAERVCAPHGGLLRLEPAIAGGYCGPATCMDGLVIKSHKIKVK